MMSFFLPFLGGGASVSCGSCDAAGLVVFDMIDSLSTVGLWEKISANDNSISAEILC